MKRHISTIYLAVLVYVALASLAVHASETLQDFDGHPEKLADFVGHGKWSVVMIWAHDCIVCNREAHNYQAFYKKHKSTDAEMLGISMDGINGKSEAKAFIKRHHLTFPNLIGEPEEVAGIFEDLTGANWRGTPTFLIYNPRGELSAQQIGAVPVSLIEQFIQKETRSEK